MTGDGRYAPHPLVTDPTRFDLVESTVRNELGTCVAHHRPVRTSARATVFLHGAAGSWSTWTPLLIEAEERGVPIPNPVLLDLPGWGAAEMFEASSSGDGHPTVNAIAALVDAVTERLGYTEWDLIGHSLGGFVALHLAATRPERVLSVGMVSGTTFSIIRSVEHPVLDFRVLPGFTMLWKVMQLLSLFRSEGRPLVRALDRAGIMRIVFAPLFRHGFRVPSSVVTATAVDLRPRSFSAAASVTRGYDAAGIWSAIGCPVRAVAGDRDVFVAGTDLDELGAVLPGSIRSIIADCGHFGAVERPAAVLSALGFVSVEP